MIDCISVDTMRRSDAYTIAHFVPSLELMYRAAEGVYKSIDWRGNVAILTGSGNNGGDGFALACILKINGYDPVVYTLGSRMSDDCRHYAEIAEGLNVEISPFTPDRYLNTYDFVVDCLLGTGFHGSVREDYRLAIEQINASGATVVSVDINSGMNGDTGEAETAVHSDLTVTIGSIKNGLITQRAGKYIKRLVSIDIGIILIEKENFICSPDEWVDFCRHNSIDPEEISVNVDGRSYFRSPEWLA